MSSGILLTISGLDIFCSNISDHFNHLVWRETAFDELIKHGVVDAHHHMIGRRQRKEQNPGLLGWLEGSYLFRFTLPSTGAMSDEWSNHNLPETQRIRSLLQFLKLTRITTYYQIIKRGLLSSFGFDIDNLNESNWQEIDKLIRQVNEREDWFEEILRRRMNLRRGVLDKHVGGTLIDAVSTKNTFDWYEYILKVRPKLNNDEINARTKVRKSDGQFSKNSIKLDTLFYGYLRCVNDELKQLFGVEPKQIRNLDTYLNYVDEIFLRISADKQNVALKIALAGVRSLDFSLTDKTKAEKVFMAEPEELQKENVVNFENFLMHHICQKAGEYSLPIQFHVATGPGGYNSSRDCSAGLLTGLILKHPKTKFDLMHGGYPNYGECAALASRFPNVYLNLAWMIMISDSESRQILENWLDYIPVNKIMWSGDCTYVEETYGTYLISKEQVIDVLGKKIDRGQISQEDALFYLQRIFCDNAMEFFGL